MNVSEELSADSYLITHDVGPNQNGIRLDHFLKERYHKRSRQILKRIISSGAISLKRSQGPHVIVGRIKPATQLIAGDQVLVLSERKPEPPVSFDYKIIHDDSGLFVIDKPANLPVHPAGKYFFNTLLIHLKTNGDVAPVGARKKDPLRAERDYYLVHRIDKETSGILVLTTDKDACISLSRQFAERTTAKRYLAVVRGVPPETFTVERPLRKARDSLVNLKMEVCDDGDEGALTASTAFKRLEVAGNFALVECYPKTGRQHQIRVHLDSAGYPIVGDKLYGRPEQESVKFYDRDWISPEIQAALLLPRHALHAAGIQFTHPSTGEEITFNSDLPYDLRKFLDQQKSN